jgi:RimJ/RimL family protein N-acetyltransferase
MALTPPNPPLTDGDVALRPLDERDLSAIERSARDAEIQRWFGPPSRTTSRRSAEEFLAGKRRAWADGTAASFAVCDVSAPDTCLGQVFVEPDHEGRGLVGYWLLPEGRGRGCATRAVRLISGWALHGLGLARVHLWVEPENARSCAVAERAGFQREGVLRSYVQRRDGRRADAVFYSLLASDFDPADFA